MEDCIFCKIIKGEIPCSKVYEDSNVLAFLDIGPVNHGHTLVIPKEHHKELKDIPDELLKNVIVAVKKISSAVKSGVSCDGISLNMSNGEEAGQVVPHAHVHIIPRVKGDGLKLWPQNTYEDGEMDKVCGKIVTFLNE
jgi:histidine triad (HIT) family protein